MNTTNVLIAVFVTAVLLSMVVLSVVLGRLSTKLPPPRRIWTAPVPTGRIVEFVPDGQKQGFKVDIAKLNGSGLTVGRDPRVCDLVVRDWYVSSRHARIWLDTEGLHIEDLKSTNGSWQNDRRIERTTFGFGESIRLGRTSFRLHALES
ncbi:MAG: FHA domain-containing protein [Hyphomicrobiaceae bacterium]